MAIEFSTIVWQMSPYKAERLVAMLAFADWSDNDGVFYPSVAELADKARLSTRGAETIIAGMLEDGEIEKVEQGGGRGHKNCYQFGKHYREAVAELVKNWRAKRERRIGKNPAADAGNSEKGARQETPQQMQGSDAETPQLKAGNPAAESSAYIESSPSCSSPSGEGSCPPAPQTESSKPSLVNAPTPEDESGRVVAFLAQTYSMVIVSHRDETALASAAEVIRQKGGTLAQVRAFFDQCWQLPKINFVAGNFLTWLASHGRTPTRNYPPVVSVGPALPAKSACGCVAGQIAQRRDGRTTWIDCPTCSAQTQPQLPPQPQRQPHQEAA